MIFCCLVWFVFLLQYRGVRYGSCSFFSFEQLTRDASYVCLPNSFISFDCCPPSRFLRFSFAVFRIRRVPPWRRCPLLATFLSVFFCLIFLFFLSERVPGLIWFGSIYLVTTTGFVSDQLMWDEQQTPTNNRVDAVAITLAMTRARHYLQRFHTWKAASLYLISRSQQLSLSCNLPSIHTYRRRGKRQHQLHSTCWLLSFRMNWIPCMTSMAERTRRCWQC